MNSRMNILSSRCSGLISRGTLESLVHVGWISGIGGFAGLGLCLGLGWGLSAGFIVGTAVNVAAMFASSAALARLRSWP